jgi:hypothetical protein
MEIVTVQFNYPNRPDYALLLAVFRFSVKKYMPRCNFIEYKISPPINKTGRPLNFNYNDVKLKIWLDHLKKTKDEVIFADCDMMLLKSAEHAFDISFDIAYTARTVLVRIPMNGGIMMVRPTKAAINFFEEMYKTNHRMLTDVSFHHKWRVKYAGMNQSAFGCVFETGKHGARIHKYLTRQWNAVDCDWAYINDKTVFCHYKSKLRKLILANEKPNGGYKIPMQLWYSMLNELRKEKINKKGKCLNAGGDK